MEEQELENDIEISGLETDAAGVVGAATASGIAGFAVVRVQASPAQRNVIAAGYINGKLVATASAADQSAPGVISSATQSFTLPIPVGAKVRFRTNLSSPAGNVFGQYFRA